MKVSEFKQIIREEVKKALTEASTPKKTVGDIIRSMPDIITWKKNLSVIYPNTKYSKTEKVINYKIEYVGFDAKNSTIVADKLFNELKAAGYPISSPDDIYISVIGNNRIIRFTVRYPINPNELQ